MRSCSPFSDFQGGNVFRGKIIIPQGVQGLNFHLTEQNEDWDREVKFMKYNNVADSVYDVLRFSKQQFTLQEVTDENREGKNIRFVAFDFNYKGKESYITAFYEVETYNYKNITMDAGFDRPASQNNYPIVIELINYLRRLFDI